MYFWTNDYSSNRYLNTGSLIFITINECSTRFISFFTNLLYLHVNYSLCWKSQSATNKNAKGSGKKKVAKWEV